MKTLEQEFKELVKKSGVRYEIDESMSGYYRLVVRRDDGNYDLIDDDPASEDVYDEESATAYFSYLIQQKHNL